MQDVAIILTTAGKEGKEEPRFLRQTATALVTEGLEDVSYSEIYCDGPWAFHKLMGGMMVNVNPDGPSGAAQGLWGAFRRFLSMPGDRLLLFEDDVLPCKNAVHYMRRLNVPADCAFVSHLDLCSTRKLPRQPGHLRIELLPGKDGHHASIGGHQACLFPRRTVEWLVERWNPRYAPRGWNGSDSLLSEMLASSHWPRYLLQRPSLFQHLGANYSRLTGKEDASDRSALWFAGEGFDALTLSR